MHIIEERYCVIFTQYLLLFIVLPVCDSPFSD